MNKKMSLLNASMMQLRAKASKAAATLDSLTENLHTLDGGECIDEIVKQTLILAEYDSAIKMLQSNFLTPLHEEMSKRRRAEGPTADLASELTQKQKDQLSAALRRPPEQGSPSELYPVSEKQTPKTPPKKARK